jgi:hypothetical protein
MMPAQALDFTYSCQASTEHFEQCAEFPLLRNRGLGPLAVTVLAIPLPRGPLRIDPPVACRPDQ